MDKAGCRVACTRLKMSQYNSLESASQIGSIFFCFEDYSKSARGMILLLLVTYSYTPILLKNAEKPTVIWLFAQNCFKSTVPSDQVTSNTAPAHQHPTGVAVYRALFLFPPFFGLLFLHGLKSNRGASPTDSTAKMKTFKIVQSKKNKYYTGCWMPN